MLSELGHDTVIDVAYELLYHQRRAWPANSDVWDLRFNWATVKSEIQQLLQRGEYRFEPLSRVTTANGEEVHVWSSRDALALKAMAIVLARYLPVSKYCTHVKGHGGAKSAVRALRAALPEHAFVMRTDG